MFLNETSLKVPILYIFSVNTSDEPVKKKTKRCSDVVHVIAPGQRKKLSNWLNGEYHDVNLFPAFFSDGKCGLMVSQEKGKFLASKTTVKNV